MKPTWYAEWSIAYAGTYELRTVAQAQAISAWWPEFERDRVTRDELEGAVRSIGNTMPKRMLDQYQAIIKAVRTERAKKFLADKPKEEKPSAEELAEAKQVWRQFMETRNKRQTATEPERITA